MLRRIAKGLLYTLATLTVLLALAVGVLRLALPQLPEYKDEIAARIADAINGNVQFAQLDARWRWHGPELVFRDVVIGPKLAERTIEPIEIETLTVTVSVQALTLGGGLEVRRVGITGTDLSVVRDAEGWWVQGLQLAAVAPAGGTGAASTITAEQARAALPLGDSVDISIDDFSLVFEQRVWQRAPLRFDLERGALKLTQRAVKLDAALRQPGNRVASADLFVSAAIDGWSLTSLVQGEWRVTTDFENLSAKLARDLLPPAWRLPLSGNADVEADVALSRGRLDAASVVLAADSLEPPDGGPLSSVAGRAEWSRHQDGWLCSISDFVVGVSDRQWPAANVEFSLTESPAARVVETEFTNVTVYDLSYLASFLPAEAAATVLASQLDGTLVRGNGTVRVVPDAVIDTLTPDSVLDFDLSLDFEELALAALGPLPGFRNLSGGVRMSRETGSLTLATYDAGVSIPQLYSRELPLDALVGTWVWRQQGDTVEVVSDRIQLESRSLQARSRIELDIPLSDGAPFIDLTSNWSLGDVNDIDAWIPDVRLNPKLVDWLQRGLVKGRIPAGDFALQGALDQFPFREGQGVFRASARAEAVEIQYARQFPALTDVTVTAELDGLELSTSSNSGFSGPVPFKDAQVSIADLQVSVLQIQHTGRSPLTDIYDFVSDTPIRDLFGGQLEKMTVAGNAAYDIDLRVPLKRVRDFTIDIDVSTNDASLALDYLPYPLTEIQGEVRIDRAGVYAKDLRGQLLGEEVTLAMQPITNEDLDGLVIEGSGTLSAAAIINDLGLPLSGRAEGGTAYTARVRLPRRKRALGEPRPVGGPRLPIGITLEAPLTGLAIDLPYPVGKDAESALPARVDLTILDDMTVAASLGEQIDIAASLQRDDEAAPFAVERATLHLGAGDALLSMTPGLYVDGSIDQLRLGDWLSLKLSEGSWLTDNLTNAAVAVDDLYLFGQRIRSVDGTLQRVSSNWLIDVQSPTFTGTVSVPTQLDSGAAVLFDMRRLALVEADPEAGGAVDPLSLPPLRVRAESFALGEREFGALEADVEKTAEGLVASRLATANDAFAMTGSGHWLRDESEDEGSRTTLQLDVRSTSVEHMMNSLGYSPGIDAEDLTSRVDVSWEGGPRDDFIE